MNRRIKAATKLLQHRPISYEAKVRSFTYKMSRKIVTTEEYKRAMRDMVIFGSSAFDPVKCLNEMGYTIRSEHR